MGSIRLARRAGSQTATSATAASTSGTATKTTGSRGWTPDGRLIFGGDDRPNRTIRSHAQRRALLRERADALAADLGQLYPALRGVRPEYAWEGLFATTRDGLPYIGSHRLYPHHLFALGYGGNGMTFGFLASKLLLDRLHGRVTADHDLFRFGRNR